jgi:SAM-dependent methyltransferase
VSSTYSDVDAGADPQEAVRWQERVDRWPDIRAYKQRIRDLLGGCDPVVDVGCGPGGDVVAIGVERCVGLDHSAVMCAAAAGRGAAVCRADAQRLPFADATLGAAVSDRVLQHLADPGAGVDEMIRVVRPGGRVVVADPDQETLTIHVPDVRPELVDQVKALRRDVGYRHGHVVSTLPSALTARGMVDVSVDAYPLCLTDPDEAFGLPTWLHAWNARGDARFSPDELAEWDRGIERARAGGFLYALLYFVVSGRRPSA